MIRREITLWVDERWCKALEKHLLDGTVAEQLEEYIDELVNKLPEKVYERISSEIWQERQQAKMETEAARRFAVLHVTEGGSSTYFVAEERLEMLQVAYRLRNYTRKPPESQPKHFIGMFSRGERISLEQFQTFVNERLENTGRVTGAFDIDLDRGRFDALHIMDGWQCFRTRDVSTAVYFAMKKSAASQDERWRVFLDRLEGKQLTHELEPGYISGSQTLRAEDISFAEDIVQNEHQLEFYMEVRFDVDKVFGTHTQSCDKHDWFNVYANYDMESDSVCDTLAVYLQHEAGGEEEFKYRLSDEEKELLLPKMEEYCQQHWGQSLDECCQQYLSEQQQEQQSSGMVFS